MMKILVDADACPVKSEIIKVAKDFNLEVIMYIDRSHELSYEDIKVFTVDKGIDSVDLVIVNSMKERDVVITQDYGLADLVLSKKGYAIHQNGYEYTKENIQRLLFERHISKKKRNAGIYGKGPKKRKQSDNEKFEKFLRDFLEKMELNT
ncbi:MAG: YaiI/YqxD family protein [Clostridia bacterium]|nr:YaiI/YqxD family protein [Clostridia bacterium]